jgi:hypothetical protein
MTTRRSFITGLISFAATAPAIVRASSLMPVKQMLEPVYVGIDMASGPDVTVTHLFYQNRLWWLVEGGEVHFSKLLERDPHCTLGGVPIHFDENPLTPSQKHSS